MKRILSLVLAMLTVLTLCVPALAEEEPEVAVEPEATIEPEVTVEPEATAEPEVAVEPEVTEAPAEPEVTEGPEAAAEPETALTVADHVYLYASNQIDGLKLYWDPIQDAVLYRLYWKQAYGGTWALLAETAGTEYLWAEAVGGVTCDFALEYVTGDGTVHAYNANGDRQTVYMAQPGNVAVTRDDGGITVTWDPVPGARSYDVFYRRGTDSDWTQIRPNRFSQYYTVRDATSYTWSYSAYSGPSADTVYYFTVRANEGTTYSIIESQSTYDQTGVLSPISGAPKISSVKNEGNHIRVGWQAVPGAPLYRVFYRTGGGNWKRLKDTAETSYTCQKPVSGRSYTFTVRVLTADGQYASAYDKTGKTITHTHMPKISKAAWSGKNVQLTWAKVSGAVRYRVFYRIGDGAWKRVGDTTKTSCTWTKAKSNTVYSFTVRCVDKAGEKYVSDYDSTGKLLAAAEGPRLTGVKNVTNGVTISWKAMSGAAQYRVFYKTGSGNWKRLGDTSSTSFTWRGGKSGTTYAFTVRCISADGKSYTSAYDKTGVTITYKPVSSSSSGSGGSSGSSGGSGGGSSSSDRGKTCWRCGGSGQRDCGVCGGSGYVTNYGSAIGGSWHERKPCPSVTCHGGKVTCSTCGGDGII